MKLIDVMEEYTNYICDKYYLVEYDYFGYTETIKGVMINYNSGNVILLSEKGIYHIPYRSIIFIKPIIPNYDKMNDEYKKVIENLINYNQQ